MTQPKRAAARKPSAKKRRKRAGRPPALLRSAGFREEPELDAAGIPTGKTTRVELTVRDALLYAAANGLSQAKAAQYAGVSKSALMEWLQRARDERARAEEKATDDKPWRDFVHNAEALYVDFADVYERARATTALVSLRTIHNASLGDWKAAAWYLERTYPQEYGARTRTDVGAVGRDGEPTTLADLFKELPEGKDA